MNKWTDWRCKHWLPWYIVSCFFMSAACLAGYTSFSFSPSISPSDVTPRHVLNGSIAEIETGTTSLGWVSAMRVIVPSSCSGAILDYRGTNCSGLVGVQRREEYTWRTVRESKYFLSGSSITVNYSEGCVGSLVILKSYPAFLEYEKLCNSTDHIGQYNHKCDNYRSLPYLLSENSTLDPLFRDNVWRFTDTESAVHHIEEPDFYYVILNYSAPTLPITTIVAYSYNLSALESYEGRRQFSITPGPGPLGNYALLPIADLFSITRPHSCKLLQSNCQSSAVNEVNEVSYLFERRRDVLGIPSVLALVFLLVFVVSILVHVCCIRKRKDRVLDQEMT